MTNRAENFDGLCCIKGCDLPEVAAGLCNKHWRRNKKYGSPVLLERPSASFIGMSAIERFMHGVKKVESGCWEWQKSCDQDGYGVFRGEVDGVLYNRAHRFSVVYHKRVHPKANENVCHSCDNPGCVNPDHLSVATVLENQRDKWRKKRGNPKIGESHWIAKITEDDVRAIRASAEDQKDIAKRYGITQSTVSDIKRRKSWRHID